MFTADEAHRLTGRSKLDSAELRRCEPNVSPTAEDSRIGLWDVARMREEESSVSIAFRESRNTTRPVTPTAGQESRRQLSHPQSNRGLHLHHAVPVDLFVVLFDDAA